MSLTPQEKLFALGARRYNDEEVDDLAKSLLAHQPRDRDMKRFVPGRLLLTLLEDRDLLERYRMSVEDLQREREEHRKEVNRLRDRLAVHRRRRLGDAGA